MIAVGEETGRLEAMLVKSADFLDMEVDTALGVLTSLMEPIMIVVLGGILLLVALAIYLPMFEIGNVITKGT
jgi:type IV pilus assembly protein PilC